MRRWLLSVAGPLGLEVGAKPLAVAVAEAEVAETAALQASMAELRGHVRGLMEQRDEVHCWPMLLCSR